MRKLLTTQFRSAPRDSGRATLIQLLWVTLPIGGATAGILIGYAHWFIVGGMLGLPLGVAAGLLLFCGIAYLLDTLMSRKLLTTNKQSTDEFRDT